MGEKWVAEIHPQIMRSAWLEEIFEGYDQKMSRWQHSSVIDIHINK